MSAAQVDAVFAAALTLLGKQAGGMQQQQERGHSVGDHGAHDYVPFEEVCCSFIQCVVRGKLQVEDGGGVPSATTGACSLIFKKLSNSNIHRLHPSG